MIVVQLLSIFNECTSVYISFSADIVSVGLVTVVGLVGLVASVVFLFFRLNIDPISSCGSGGSSISFVLSPHYILDNLIRLIIKRI